jgi:cytochrome c556
MSRIEIHFTMALTIALIFTATTEVCAEDAKQIVNARQEQLKILERTAKALGHELERSAPDRAAVAKDATKIAALVAELPNWFPAGSGPDVVRTAAKADVWTRPAEFRKAGDSLLTSARLLTQLSTSDDLAAVRRQTKILSETCDDCHDAFRNRWLLLRPW